MSKFLLVGLGNIGAEYEGTRHNIGFDVADAVARKHDALFTTERLAQVARLRMKGKIVICIKPTTYMNLSGKAVKYWMDKESVSLENILVIVDEVALPLNKIRIRPGGSSAGHNGLGSIQEILLTDQYPRLRFGIGNNYPKGMQVEYVLGKWFKEDLPLVQHKIEKSAEAAETFVAAGIERAMNMYNKMEFSL
jgi:PTH1 family peptidyl-tRNA hydrolase